MCHFIMKSFKAVTDVVKTNKICEVGAFLTKEEQTQQKSFFTLQLSLKTEEEEKMYILVVFKNKKPL